METFFHFARRSRNGKTGPIPVTTTSKNTCPDCPLEDACYAKHGRVGMHWDKVSRGERGGTLTAVVALIRGLKPFQLWRHNQAGDLPGEGNEIDGAALGEIVAANRDARARGFTYTHKPMTPSNMAIVAAANRDGFTVNLSGNNPTHADELAALNIAPVVTVLPIEYGRRARGDTWLESLDEYRARVAHLPKRTPAGRAMPVCPATYLDTSCKDCGLCARQRHSVVGFPGHGAGAAIADAVAKGEVAA